MSCLFCDIVEKKLASYIVYENEEYMAFLDRFPAVEGHTLVIPKKHIRWVYEAPPGYWEAVLKVTSRLQEKLKPQFINYYTYGYIPHAHIHILPRFESITTQPPVIPQTHEATDTDLAHLLEKINK